MYHPDGEVVHSVYVPGLGRRTSRHRAESNASAATSTSPPLASPDVVDGTTLVVPNGHNLVKANTAPPGSSPTSSKFPVRPLTSFWHRRTGSGPRKTKIGESSTADVPMTPPRTNKLQRSRSTGNQAPQGPPTDGHSFAGESVNEAGEEQEQEPSMRRLLAQENQKEKGNQQHIKFPDNLVSPSGKTIPQSPTSPSQKFFTNAYSSSPAAGAVPVEHSRAATEPPLTGRESSNTDYFNALGPHILIDAADAENRAREEAGDFRGSDGTIRPGDARLMTVDNPSVPSIVVTDEEHDHPKPAG